MLFTPTERAFADLVRRLAYANPFDNDEQATVRRELLVINLGLADEERRRPTVATAPDSFEDVFARRIEALLIKLLARIEAGTAKSIAVRTDQRKLAVRESQLGTIGPDEIERYEDLIITVLHLRHFAPFDVHRAANGVSPAEAGKQLAIKFRQFREDFARWTRVPFALGTFLTGAEHAFAIYFQYRLAFGLLQDLIHGESRPVARLRAATWHSIFPRELRLYGVLLFERMHDVTTLILGPSGTGKELVATAIGLARFVPFDSKRERFVEPFANAFHPINLSAMPRDLIESEMFGHSAGAFTGATKDREGWFEKCKRGHTVFLDEIGELAESVQVRLLRVLQNREFYRVGDTEPRRFEGRVIAATNRDLAVQIADNRFREDLYFRLCSDMIRTPTLREQLDDSPDELPALVSHVAARCLGDKAALEYVATYTERLTQSTLAWIESSAEMGPAYAWPGNFRELEQCVRSMMVRGEYRPPARYQRPLSNPHAGSHVTSPSYLDRFIEDIRGGRLGFEELLVRYCSLVHSRTGNVAETARRLNKHRVTVQGRIEQEWVERFRE